VSAASIVPVRMKRQPILGIVIDAMSTPDQPLPPPKEPHKNSGTLLAAIVIAVVLMGIGCAGVCAGFLYYAVPRARVAMQQANLRVPSVAIGSSPNDWMETRTLSQIYTTGLAAVVENKDVIKTLGEPVVTDLEAAELFRRTDTSEGALSDIILGAAPPGGGPPGSGPEQIEFDISGPKGTAVVTVTAAGPQNLTKITVTLEDGSTIDVPPPEPQPFIVR
jgi:hypothetical protein